MARNQKEMLNLTLYFDYANNEAGYRQTMTSLDRIAAQAEQSMRNNSKLFDEGEMEQSIQQYRQYIERMKSAVENTWNPDLKSFNLSDAIDIDEEAFSKIQNGFGGVRVSMQETDASLAKSGAELSKYSEKIENFKFTLGNAFRYNVVNEFVDIVSGQIKNTIYYIQDLDRALNSIRIVSGKSADDMYSFADSANSAAKALARTATEYAQASQIYYQQGLAQEDVIKRTNDTLMLANITGDSVADAADKLTSVMNGYQLATKDSTRALDVMAKLGADTATDFAEIAGAMQKVAAQANSANLSLEQTSAMLATIMSITREAPETVGTSLKAIIARLNELKFAQGEETSRVQKQFVNIGMSIFDANDQLKETTVLFDEIAERFKTADVNTKKVIATAVAGAEQQNRFLTLMENWDTYNSYLEKAYTSSGSALQQNEVYMESIQAKSKELKSTLDAIKFDALGKMDFAGMLDDIDDIASTVRVMIDDFGGLNQLLTVGGALLTKMFAPQVIEFAIKKVRDLYSDIKRFSTGSTALFDFSKSIPQLTEINQGFRNSVQNAQLMRSAMLAGGQDGVAAYERIRDKLISLNTSYDAAIDKIARIQSIRNISDEEVMMPINELEPETQARLFEETTKSLQTFGIESDKAKSIVYNLIGEIDSLTTRDQFMGQVQLAAGEEIKNTNNALSGQALQARKSAEGIDRLSGSFNQMMGAMKKAQTFNLIISTFGAASIAVTGLETALKKLVDGDSISAVSTMMTSLGSAAMMLGNINPMLTAVGAGVALAGAGVSLFNSHLKRAQEEARKLRDANVELTKSYNDNAQALKSTLKNYEELIEKQKLTNEEQSSLNETIDQFQRILGEENKFVAYYDAAGIAVYKTKEQVQDLIDKWKETQVEAAKAAIQQSKDLAKDESKTYVEEQKKVLSISDDIQEYRDGIELLKEIKAEYAETLDESSLYEELLKYFGAGGQYSNLGINVSSGIDTAITEAEFNLDNLEGKLGETIAHFGENYENLGSLISSSFTVALSDIDNSNIEVIMEDVLDRIQAKLTEGALLNVETIGDNITQAFEIIKSSLNNQRLDWNKIFTGEPTSIQDLSDAIDALVENNPEFKNASEILTMFLERLRENSDATEKARENNENYAASVIDLVGSLEYFDEVIDGAREALEEFREHGELSYDSIKALTEAFGDTTGFDAFLNSIIEGELNVQEFESGLDSLIGAFWEEKIALDGVTEANKQQLVTMLRSIGVVNAEELANRKLVDSLIKSKSSTIDLSSSVIDLGIDFEALGISTSEVELALYDYQLQLIEASRAQDSFDAVAMSDKLLAIADAAGISGAAINVLKANLQTGNEKGIDVAIGQAMDLVQKQIEERRAAIIAKASGQSKIGSGSSKSGGSSKETKAYEAEIDKYIEFNTQIAELKEQIGDLDAEIGQTAAYEEKNKLIETQIELMKKQQDAQHQLNNARDEEIKQNVELLRQQGFDVYYDEDVNKLQISNLEHLNELKSSDQEATNELIKKYEDLIKKTQTLNEANIESSKTWRDLNSSIAKATKQIEENIRSGFADKVNDKLFNAVFFEGLAASQNQIKAIYENVLSDYNEELERAYAQGLDNTDDYIQSLIKKISGLKNDIVKLEEEIFDSQIKNFDRVISTLANSSRTLEKQISLSAQKILAIDNRIAELEKKNILEVGEKLLELYKNRADAIKDEYELRKKSLEGQKDGYNTAIDAVTTAIDKEIEKLKEEQSEREKANEERKKEIELMELKAALERAQSQKTIQVFRKDLGFVWEADQTAIDDAQKALDNFYASNETDEIQERIDALEKYKEKWSSIPTDIQQAENEIKAAEVLGKNWQEEVFNMREDILDSFRDNYETTADDLKKAEQQYQSEMERLAEETESLQRRIEEAAAAIKTAFSSMFGGGNAYYADAAGKAPSQAGVGDVVATTGGSYLIGEKGQEGFAENPETQLWSKKISDFSVSIDRLTGTKIVDNDILKAIAESLQNEMADLLEDGSEKTADNTAKLRSNTEISVKLDKDLGIYSGAIVSAVENTDASSKSAAKSAQSASSSASDAASSAYDAARSAQSAADSARSAASSASSMEGTMNHGGLNMGPVGSTTGKEAFDKDFLRIANGDLKSNELLALLTEGEAVMTPEQLNNVVGALNFSLNTIEELQSMQKGLFNAGKLSGLNALSTLSNNNIGAGTSFGDINIVMHGVNDVNTFSTILQNNIKNIFAQTVASR